MIMKGKHFIFYDGLMFNQAKKKQLQAMREFNNGFMQIKYLPDLRLEHAEHAQTYSKQTFRQKHILLF